MSHQLPHFIQETIPSELQINWDELAASHVSNPVTSIRVNPLKNYLPEPNLDKVAWCEHGYYLPHRPSFTADPCFHAGGYYVQEASSMFLDCVLKSTLDLTQPLRILDLCASPGGKSTLVASLLPKDSLLISNETIQGRVSALNENAVKWGSLQHHVTNNDAADWGKIENYVDVLLVDAPCSGSGLFRKMPEYMDDITPNHIQLCASRQKKILQESYPCLSKNGILVYMTCSFSRDENEDIVDYLLSHFELETCPIKLHDEWGVVETESDKHRGFGYRFFPHLLKGEGFFLACFRKKDGEEKKALHPIRIKPTPLPLSEYFQSPKQITTITLKDQTIAVPENLLADYHYLQGKIKWIKKGIMLGKWINKELIPDHELAMCNNLNQQIQQISLTLDQAILYLKREPFLPETTSKGWTLVTYKSIPLGWIKHLGNRINNYYPQNYRILSKNI